MKPTAPTSTVTVPCSILYLDDNGDGKGNNALNAGGLDGQQQNKRYLGATSGSGTNPALGVITAVAPAQYLGANDFVTRIYVDVNDANLISPARYEVRPPSITLALSATESSEQLAVEGGDSDFLFCSGQRCDSTVSLSEAGRYDIFYTVTNADTGEVSPARRGTVYKNRAGNNAPAAVTGLDDQGTYYWRITAVDTYGARTASQIRGFTVNNPNAIDTLVALDIRDAGNAYQDVTGYTVTTDSGSFTLDKAQAYLALPVQNSLSLTISRDGYQSQTFTLDTTLDTLPPLNIDLCPLDQACANQNNPARFNPKTGILDIPSVYVPGVGIELYRTRLNIEPPDYRFRLIPESTGPGIDAGADKAQFANGILHLPTVDVESLGRFDVKLNLEPGSNPMLFVLDLGSVAAK